ncbi:MAG: asparagine synthase (glutamine-hydrolyzing) [Oscillospiraceae bacterium]|nr:asparagine synthase (glutamine-hydrolyzing) [Oscillospiraceae bacterium]MDY3258095.1 asparagine synthase (glutamine-hydrolyzing) [Ruminococcus callidus]
MCGFVGFINKIDNSNKVLCDMLDAIKHRGPDAEGTYIDDDIALGHRRLSIIDVSDTGNQPLYSEDGTKVLVFNGEIYNYMDIRNELISKGYKFRTKTDSEVLIHGYTEYGKELLSKLRGMFSFVIWDKTKKELFGVRDFFGIKPLYYYKNGSDFMFGSEIKSFLRHPAFKKELNEAALENYLTFQYSVSDETFFKNVYKLPPAHYFLYKDGKLEIKRYWDVHFNEDEKPSLDEWVNKISDVFHDSVAAHKIADVEVGSFLSSGVDSSYVACIADVDKTFTVGFDNGSRYNEIDWAKGFSKAIGKKNYSKVISDTEYWDNLKMIQYHMDEPLADPSAIALYFVCNTAHNHNLKVCLSGEGADELFGGYNVYSEPNSTAYDKLPRGLRRGIGNIASKLPEHRGRNFFVRKGKDLEERFIGNAYMFTPEQRKDLLKIKTNAPDPQEITKPYYDKVKDKDAVTKMQYIDIHLWMAGDILLKADKMSMANSLEVRVPFLDKKVMELAEKIPSRYRVTREEKTDENTPYITKYAMRLAAKKDTPSETAKTAAKKKLGFPVPTRVWLKEDKYYNIVNKKFTGEAANKFFHTEKLVKLLEDHKNGKADNSRRIWTVYMFLLWYEVYFESDDIKKTISTKLA